MCVTGAHFILAALCRRPVRAHLKSGGSPAASWLCPLAQPQEERRASLLLWLLCQPGEKKRLCSSCASWSFPQPLSSRLASPGFREHCTRYSRTTGVTNRIGQTTLPGLPFFPTLHPVLQSRACWYSCCLSHLQPPCPTSPGHPDSGIHPLRSLSLTPTGPHPSQPGYSFLLVLHAEVLRTCLHYIKLSSSESLNSPSCGHKAKCDSVLPISLMTYSAPALCLTVHYFGAFAQTVLFLECSLF